MEELLNYKIDEGPLKVKKISVMHGANYFSAGPIIVMRFDLGEYDEVFTNEISGFYEELTKRLPSLIEHHCSIGERGGFFKRVKEGTLLGHVTEHTAIELQTLAGMDVGYGKTRSTNEQGVYNVVFRFFDEAAGIYAGKAAVNLINSILLHKEFDISSAVKNLIYIREKRLLGPSTQAIVDEALKRDIPYLRLDEYNLVQLGTGKYAKRIRATITSDTSLISVETADNKFLTKKMLKDAGVPVPETELIDNKDSALEFFRKVKKPIVLKPHEGYLGKAVSTNLSNEKEVEEAFKYASEFDEDVLVQPYIKGDMYRILVIDYKFSAAVKLTPPKIVGDGVKTVKQLVEEMNEDPLRRIGDKFELSRVEIDDITLRLLKQKGFTEETVLKNGEEFYLKVSGNMKLGGKAEDVTDIVHPMNKFYAERAAKTIGLNAAGIDIITQDISTSIFENGGKVIEVNAAPDFRMHMMPTVGESRNPAADLTDMLFPKGVNTRIPIFSVTGTAGKTTTVNIIAHALQMLGYSVGKTSTEGLFINEKCLMEGDMTFPEHVALVLKDPDVDCAVLETSAEGIIRRGLGYKFADFGIFLNMYDDHVGNDDIKYIEDLSYAKSVTAEEVYEDGFTILNADNEDVMDCSERLYSQLVLFSQSYENEYVREHCNNGGLAAVMDGKYFVILDGSNKIDILHSEDIPLTLDGKANLNNDNILAASAALYAFGTDIEIIKKTLKTFKPDKEMLPGRMNLFEIDGTKILVDYAHNNTGLLGIGEYLSNFSCRKIGVVDSPGDRSDEVIKRLGKISSEIFDSLIFYEGIDLRGREKGEVTELLKNGALENGFEESHVKVFTDYKNAWKTGLELCETGDFLVILSGRGKETIEVIENFKQS